jgi:hypothetical protein
MELGYISTHGVTAVVQSHGLHDLIHSLLLLYLLLLLLLLLQLLLSLYPRSQHLCTVCVQGCRQRGL